MMTAVQTVLTCEIRGGNPTAGHPTHFGSCSMPCVPPRPQVCDEVYAPEVGEKIDVSNDVQMYKIKLRDAEPRLSPPVSDGLVCFRGGAWDSIPTAGWVSNVGWVSGAAAHPGGARGQKDPA